MRTLRVFSLTNQALIAEKCHVALFFWERMKGLIGKKIMGPQEAMLFPKCNSIHMWWMKIPIDVVFLKETSATNSTSNSTTHSTAAERKTWKITSLHPHVRPWKIIPLLDFRADDTLELADGSIEKSSLKVGDELWSS